MAKQKYRFRGVKCAYCGVRPATTADHVFPRSLFGQNLSNPITVPSCGQCNKAKSAFDDYLRDMLLTDIGGSEHPIAQTLVDGKFTRSLQGGHSRALLNDVAEGEWQDLITHGGIYLGDAWTWTPDVAKVEGIFSFIARGLIYKEYGERLPENYNAQAVRVPPTMTREIWDKFKETGVRPFVIGDNVVVGIGASCPNDRFSSGWVLVFYGGTMFLVTTNPSQLDIETTPAAPSVNHP